MTGWSERHPWTAILGLVVLGIVGWSATTSGLVRLGAAACWVGAFAVLSGKLWPRAESDPHPPFTIPAWQTDLEVGHGEPARHGRFEWEGSEVGGGEPGDPGL